MLSVPDNMICDECGAEIPTPQDTTKCELCGHITETTLEHFGYTITKAGGKYILKTSNGENIDIVRDSITGREELAHKIKVNPELIKKAYMKAIQEPKNGNGETKEPEKLEIFTGDYKTKAPDQGVHDGRAYFGAWLPVKITDQETNTTRIRKMYFLVFDNGDYVEANPHTLSQMGMYLSHTPVQADLRVTIETIMQLRNLPPVDRDELLTDLVNIFKRYIEFDDEKYYSLCAVWVIGTYFYKRFSTYPYLFLNAVKRSGKTKLLTILSLLCYNAVFSPNMSPSSLFRLVQNNGATVLLDETEDLDDPEKKAEFRSLLLSGYKRGAKVYRSEKNEDGIQTPTPFDPYSPKAIANIRGIEDVLEDRTLPIILKRGLDQTIMNREIPIDSEEWFFIRDRLMRFYLQEWKNVDELYENTSNSSVVSVVNAVSVVIWGIWGSKLHTLLEKYKTYTLSGRDWELWKPLFAISSLYVSENSEEVCKIETTPPEITTLTTFNAQTTLPYIYDLSIQITEEKNSDTRADAGESVLLMGLLALVIEKTPKYYSIGSLRTAASRYNDNLPEWFNTRWIGRALKRLGFKDKRRMGGGMEYKLTSTQVQDMANRLGVFLPEDEPEPEDIPEEKETKLDQEEPKQEPEPLVFDGYEMEKLYNVVKDNPDQTKERILTLAFKAGLSPEESSHEFRKLTGGYITHNAGKWRVK